MKLPDKLQADELPDTKNPPGASGGILYQCLYWLMPLAALSSFSAVERMM